MLSIFPRDVLDEILNLMEAVSEGFPTYSYNTSLDINPFIAETTFVTPLSESLPILSYCQRKEFALRTTIFSFMSKRCKKSEHNFNLQTLHSRLMSPVKVRGMLVFGN